MPHGASDGDSPFPGYARVAASYGEGVALAPVAPAIREILDKQTLYEYAAAQPDHRTFVGRGPAYAVSIGGVPVVVRHTRHGGLLAPLTRDIFFAPTRAPGELAISLRLRAAGVRTPEVVAYATYRAGPGLRRADVVTREVAGARSLATLMLRSADFGIRNALFHATGDLVMALSEAGAVHPDLNMRNVLIASRGDGGLEAHVVDVDRVAFPSAELKQLAIANFGRLHESADKLGIDWGR